MTRGSSRRSLGILAALAATTLVAAVVSPSLARADSTATSDDWGFASVTLDDGRSGQYTDAMPALDQRGIQATFYIIGEALTWGSGYMTAPQVQQIAADGHEIGNHTYTHPDLTTLTSSEIRSEFTTAQTTLQSKVGVTPTTCAYPYGAYNSTVTSVASTIFKACRTTEGGLNSPSNYGAYTLKMFYVHTSTTAAEIRAAADDAKNSKTWVIFVYHGVGKIDSTDDVAASTFSAHLDAIKASGLPTKTVSQAVDYINAPPATTTTTAPPTSTTTTPPSTTTPPPTTGAIGYVGSSSKTTAAATTIAGSTPSGVSAGDVLVASLSVDNSPGVTAPAGWTRLANMPQIPSGVLVDVYYHVAGASEPATATWTLASAQKASIGITAYRGVNTSSPFATGVVTKTGSATSISISGLTTSVPNTMLIGGLGLDSKTATVTPPSGFTQAFSTSLEGQVDEQAYKAQAGTGSAGTLTWSISGALPAAAWATALTPAAATPPPPTTPPPTTTTPPPTTTTAPPTTTTPPPTTTTPPPTTTTPPPTTTTPPPPTTGAISYVGSSSKTTAAAATIAGSTPSGVTAGDVLVASLSIDNSPAVTAPAGWTRLANMPQTPGGVLVDVYYRVAGASEPATATWTFASAQKASIGITAYRGVNTSSPFATGVLTAKSGSATSLSISGLTTSVPNTMLIGGLGVDTKTSTVTPPSGFSQAFSTTLEGQVDEQAYKTQAGTGSAGTLTWTISSALPVTAWATALTPA